MNVEEVMDVLTFAETLKAPSLASVDLVIVLILTREAAQVGIHIYTVMCLLPLNVYIFSKR